MSEKCPTCGLSTDHQHTNNECLYKLLVAKKALRQALEAWVEFDEECLWNYDSWSGQVCADPQHARDLTKIALEET
jgi:hypothetical protein